MPYNVVTLSSVGTAGPLAINWRCGGPTMCAVTLGSTTMTTQTLVQYTVDDLQISSSPKWFNVSSFAVSAWSTVGGSTASGTAITSALADNSLVFNFQFPIAGLRLNSTAISAGGSVSLRVLQSESW